MLLFKNVMAGRLRTVKPYLIAQPKKAVLGEGGRGWGDAETGREALDWADHPLGSGHYRVIPYQDIYHNTSEGKEPRLAWTRYKWGLWTLTRDGPMCHFHRLNLTLWGPQRRQTGNAYSSFWKEKYKFCFKSLSYFRLVLPKDSLGLKKKKSSRF